MIEDTMREIENAFVTLKAQEVGHRVRSSDGLRKVLPKAAEYCEELKADPLTYVKAQRKFSVVKDFYPNVLIASKYRENYQRYLELFETDLEQTLKNQKLYLLDGIRAGRKVENILMDEQVDFTAWFRILITTEPLPEVVDRYKEKAQSEMTPKLINFLKKIPQFDLKRILNE